MARGSTANLLGLGAALAVSLASGVASAEGAWVAADGQRVRAGDRHLAAGAADRLDAAGRLALSGLRGEVLSFQVIVEASAEPLDGVRVELEPRSPGALDAVRVERFVEHYVEVASRSANDQRPEESLGWSPAARPPDHEQLGWVPDALIPVEVAPPFRPYPMRVEATRSAAVWFDLAIAADAEPGRRESTLRVTTARGEIGVIPLELEIVAATMPYRAVSFFAYYGTYELESRFGEAPLDVEKQLWQLLHAHHVDATPSGMVTPEAIERVRPALDGTLFTREHGYEGPGPGVLPGLVILGTYGELGDASEDGVRRVRELVQRLPAGIEDVVLYAVDEKCDSPRGPGWRRALREAEDPILERVLVAHTCSRDPAAQDVDLVLTTAPTFRPPRGRRANAPRLWAYNGALPGAGPMVLDAPLTSMTANGWIAASYGVPRWFFWETTFYNDDNPGGRGPVDPFLSAETFHNKDGDRVLYDGLLVFPGQQRGRLPPSKNHDRAGELFVGLDADHRGVFPSMRLKALRRGIQDAGLYALARAHRPGAADAIVERVVPRAMADVDIDEATPWELSARRLEEARGELRRLVPAAPPSSPGQVLAALAGAPEALGRGAGGPRRDKTRWAVGGALLALLTAVLWFDGAHARRARGR